MPELIIDAQNSYPEPEEAQTRARAKPRHIIASLSRTYSQANARKFAFCKVCKKKKRIRGIYCER